MIDILKFDENRVRVAGKILSEEQKKAEGSVAECLKSGNCSENISLSVRTKQCLHEQQRVANRTWKPKVESDHVEDIFKKREDFAGHLKSDLAESVYHSKKTAPLGKSMNRGYKIPNEISVFGVSSSSSEGVKDIMNPTSILIDSNAENLYKRSHGSYASGEQVKRGYNWNIDEKSVRFGRASNANFNKGASYGVTDALRTEDNECEANRMSVQVQQFKIFKDAPLGKARSRGQRSDARDARTGGHNFVYGIPSIQENCTAKKCIHGNYSLEEQRPDKDLGCSMAPGYRNYAREDRIFGIPNIRNDIAVPVRRSVADCTNYGDELSATQLVNPGQFSALGIEDEEFFCLKTKNELKLIFAAIGKSYDESTFSSIFLKASRDSNLASISDFQKCAAAYEIGL